LKNSKTTPLKLFSKFPPAPEITYIDLSKQIQITRRWCARDDGDDEYEAWRLTSSSYKENIITMKVQEPS
jgi:hypothetical protein